MFYFIVFLLVFFDQITKLWAFNSFRQAITIIPNFFYILYIENRGAAFGILKQQRWFLIFASLLFVIIFFSWIRKQKIDQAVSFKSIGSVLLLAGSIGNLIDRLFRGFVIDFFYFTFFPIFNIADILINLGVFCLILAFLKEKKADK